MRDETKFIALFAGCLFLLVCAGIWCSEMESDIDAPTRALEDAGYSNLHVHTGSVSPFAGCGDDDGVAYSATATNPIGKNVSVVVCCGVFSFKGCTIRSR